MLKFVVIGLLVLVAAAAGFVWLYRLPDLRPRYRVVEINLPGGQHAYFKREMRGLNYDGVTLSSDPRPCVPPNEGVDYVFKSLDPLPIFWKVDGATLHIYSGNVPTMPPSNKFSVDVIHHELAADELRELAKEPGTRGLTKLDIALDDQSRCS